MNNTMGKYCPIAFPLSHNEQLLILRFVCEIPKCDHSKEHYFLVLSLLNQLLGSFGFDYEYETECEYNFSNLVCVV